MKKTLCVLSIMSLVFASVFASGAQETAAQEGMTWSNWSGSEEASKGIFNYMIEIGRAHV